MALVSYVVNSLLISIDVLQNLCVPKGNVAVYFQEL